MFGFGNHRRNDPYRLDPCNPKPENKMSSETGDAGKDGFTVLAKAPRSQDHIGVRPTIGGTPIHEGPRYQEEQ